MPGTAPDICRGRVEMRRNAIITALILLPLLLAAGASAMILRAGELVVEAEGGFTPTTLPRHKDAPITIFGSGKASTTSGELPPIVETLTIEFDRHGHVETEGLEVCSAAKLRATTVTQARKACPGAIVGEGEGSAIVAFPEQRPIPISSPITLFNGPKKGGDDTVIAHAYTTVPAPTTFIVPIVIERIHNGTYGYRTKAKIPKIAGGYGHTISGHLRIGKHWGFRGSRHSYVNARCETGHLNAKVQVTFVDGTRLSGTFFKRCEASD
jgi:hypothetical protein